MLQGGCVLQAGGELLLAVPRKMLQSEKIAGLAFPPTGSERRDRQSSLEESIPVAAVLQRLIGGTRGRQRAMGWWHKKWEHGELCQTLWGCLEKTLPPAASAPHC